MIFRTQMTSSYAELGETCAATTPSPLTSHGRLFGLQWCEGYAATTLRPVTLSFQPNRYTLAFFDCGVASATTLITPRVQLNDNGRSVVSHIEKRQFCVRRSRLRSKAIKRCDRQVSERGRAGKPCRPANDRVRRLPRTSSRAPAPRSSPSDTVNRRPEDRPHTGTPAPD